MKKFTTQQIAITLALIVVALTPFYGVAYVAALVYAANYIQPSKTFNSVVSRFILALLIMVAVIMAIGMVLWFVHIALHPLITLASFALSIYGIGRLSSSAKKTTTPVIDRGDILSAISASTIILLIVAFFYLPKPQDSASVQIITNGYDNIAHVSLLTTDAIEGGYVYGYEKDVSLKTLSALGAYPQGWHLATSHIMNGFGVNLLQPTKPLLTANAYVAILFIWYFITVYIAGKIAWRILQNDLSEKLRNKLDVSLVFLLASLLIQLLVYWGSLLFGFASFFGCLAYLLLLTALVIDKDESNSRSYLFIACMATLAAAQSWIIPLPAMLATIILGFFWHKPLPKWRQLFQKPTKHTILSLGFLLIAFLGGLFQIWILLRFTSVGATSAQLIAPGGIFWTSNLLVGVLLLFTFAYWLYDKKSRLSDSIIATLAPILLVSAAVYIYQMLMAEATSYYFVKTFGLAMSVLGVFFVPAFILWIVQLKKHVTYPLAGAVIASSILATLVIGSGQNLLNFSGFMQRNSHVTTATAEAIVHHFKTTDSTKNQLFVFRNESVLEDTMGTYFANRLIHRADLCGGIVRSNEQPMSDKLKRFKKCIDRTKDHITVITSDKTDSELRSRFGTKNITYVKIP